MKILIVAETKEDIPEDAQFDCMGAVEDTLKEHGLELKDINFEIDDS